ncbi:MAG: M28 family peptidase [Acidobacteriota bacterium]|nr:M28 family peptidase [Acidobacteriota bacterium]
MKFVNKLYAKAARQKNAALLCALLCLGLFAACRGAKDASASAQNPTPVSRPALNPADFDPAPGTPAALKVSGERAFKTLKEFVVLGPRYVGSKGHEMAERYIVDHLQGAEIEQDHFNAQTVLGQFPMDNIIAKFPGKKDGILVIAGHYDTNYPLKNTSFIGANDGGSNVGLMLEIAAALREHGNDGYSVWLVFTDGEEAMKTWSDQDSVYGSKQLAARWAKDGTADKVKAFLLLDMIGDKDLHLEQDANSTPWLAEVVRRAGARAGRQAVFSNRVNGIEDDHLPFRAVGIPVDDIIDLDYGFDNIYHHTTEDTPDKCSAQSLQAVGDIVMETLRALNTH